MARVFKHSKTLLDAGWGGQLLLWAPVWQFPSPNPCPMFTKNPSQSSPIITVLTISVLHQTTRNPFYAPWDQISQIRVKSHLSRFFLEAIARLLSIPNCSGQWEFSPDSENDFWLILQIFRASPWPKPQLCIIMGALHICEIHQYLGQKSKVANICSYLYLPTTYLRLKIFAT